MSAAALETRGPLSANPLWLLGLIALIAYGLRAGPYEQRLLATAGCYALLALGYQFILGHAGALSLAQGAFFGFGTYASGLLALRLGWDFPAAFAGAIASASALAFLVGLPVLRLGSHYFALATLAFAQLLQVAAVEWVSLTGGGNGLPGIPGFAWGDRSLAGTPQAAGFIWLSVALAGACAAMFDCSRAGDAHRLLREAPLAAAAIGIDGGRRRMGAFLLSAAFGAAAGSLSVHSLGVAAPEAFGFDIMVLCLCMTVIGGRGSVPGAIAGALLLVHLPEWLRGFERWALFAYGAGLLAAIVLAPRGIAGAVDDLWHELAARRRRPAAPAIAPIPVALEGGGTLEASDLSIAFGGNLALADFNLRTAPGEIVGLIGPNGSGKTTALNLLSGFHRPRAGRILLDGRDITDESAWRRARSGLARTFQHPALASELDVLGNVAIARPGRSERARARAEAMALLARVGGTELASRPVGGLVQAERRRVEIARALAADPRVLLLDEPATGLSAEESEALARLLRSLATQGLALLVVDHAMSFLLPLADRLICLDAGRTLAAGRPDEVAAHPEVRRVYLGADRR